VPLVTVLLATHDDARYLPAAVESVLGQTLEDLELLVIDDASTDSTPELLEAVKDPRLRVLRNEVRRGLAFSLNRGLDLAEGRYVARLDADDVALPERLERQLGQLRETGVAALGTAVRDIDEAGRTGRLHQMPVGTRAVRWHALFSSPFFHPTVLVDRELLDRHHLRYDRSFHESEDYDLWTRLLATGAEGGNVPDPLVLKRVHPDQASLRRSGLQRSFQRNVALREIARISPAVDGELAWSFGINASRRIDAARAYRQLLHAFERLYGADEEVRTAAARRLARGRSVGAAARVAIGRGRHTEGARGTPRVSVVSPEPTPYRAPLFDRIAERLDLTVIYAAATVADRTWSVTPNHHSVFLRGIEVPTARRLLHHAYPITPGVVRALRRARPDVVVVSGWSTFAAQAAVAWCRRKGIPYVLLVESHDLGPRRAWRRAVKGAAVPRVLRGAAGVLVVGTLARESVVARGADPERVRVFANTIDVDGWSDRVAALRKDRDDGDVVVLSVGRLAPEKGFDTLVRAVAAAGDSRLRIVVAGEGPEREHLAALAAELEVPLALRGDLPSDALAAEYASADVFALLSRREPWGVVVNEGAASALPLVLSDQVGAAYDLLRDGENGFLVPAGDVEATARALRALLDPEERRRAGARARELVAGWGYEPSVEAFVAAVGEAAASR
jgi:glycosyltransferase involved in cell wall biosynthesis